MVYARLPRDLFEVSSSVYSYCLLPKISSVGDPTTLRLVASRPTVLAFLSSCFHSSADPPCSEIRETVPKVEQRQRNFDQELTKFGFYFYATRIMPRRLKGSQMITEQSSVTLAISDSPEHFVTK